MPLMVELPDEIAMELGENQAERSQRAKEAIALELYREGKISLRTMGRMAGVGEDYWAADAFRASHGMAVSGPEEPEGGGIEHFLP
jgi:hypothetical protein